MKIKFLALSLLVFALLSCKKEPFDENNGIYGTWLLVDRFDGYHNGGNFQWNAVQPNTIQYLEFGSNQTYKSVASGNSSFECIGTFEILANDTLKISTNCNTAVFKDIISHLTNSILIIDQQGVIRYRYKAIK